MSGLDLCAVRLTDPAPDRPILLVGPSLGTSVAALWRPAARLLADSFEVVGWELPGHGTGPPAERAFTVRDLADGVVALAERLHREQGRPGEAFEYAGVSLGGAVGLQLAHDHPDRLLAATVLCSGARIGQPGAWRERAAQVRAHGTASLLPATPARWFAPGFVEREPAAGAALLDSLRDADDGSYAWACEALAAFDITGELAAIRAPIVAVAGAVDAVAPASGLALVAEQVRDGRLVVLDGVAHLAPAEAPHAVAHLVAGRARREGERTTAGFAVRRAVLGERYVDRAIATSTPLTAAFQDFITRYAWGTVWTRPALTRRERSLMTLTALVAGGHLEELALHTRAARTNGLSDAEIAECVLHSAIYCGVPAANSALRVVERTLHADGDEPAHPAGER